MSQALSIRPYNTDDKSTVDAFIRQHWGTEYIVVHDTIYYPAALNGFFAEMEGQLVGLISYNIQNQVCEIVTLDSDIPELGIGSHLIEAVRETAQTAGCSRLWLITTNDNLNALRFYQKRGFVLAAIHRNAVKKARLIKPEIPLIGEEDIPIRDEIELELLLTC